MPDTPDSAESLLREIVDILGDRPYHALDRNGPFMCVFCGGETVDETQPQHMAGCPWPRVLKLVATKH